MHTFTKATLVLGCCIGSASLLAVTGATSAAAQGFYFNAPGVHVRVGHPHRRYYDYYPGPSGWDTYNGCPPGYTVQSGICKPYRGY